MKFNLIYAETMRSKYYLDSMILHKIFPKKIIYFSKSKNLKLINKFKKHSINFKYFNSDNINDSKLKNYIINLPEKNFIYSGYPGDIVNLNLTKNKSIFHFHPGKLPWFKGSTTIYYSLILKKGIFCSCIKLNDKIDDGKIFLIKSFNPPKNIKSIESKFDHEIRAKTLIAFLKMKRRKIYKINSKEKILHYYIAHPILRSLIINRKIFFKLKSYKL